MNTKLLINGRFVVGKGDHHEQILDPATGTVIAPVLVALRGCERPQTSYDCGMRRPTASHAWEASDYLENLYRELAPAVLGYLRGSGAADPWMRGDRS